MFPCALHLSSASAMCHSLPYVPLEYYLLSFAFRPWQKTFVGNSYIKGDRRMAVVSKKTNFTEVASYPVSLSSYKLYPLLCCALSPYGSNFVAL